MKSKRVLAATLALCMAISLTACGSKEKPPEEKLSDTINSTYDSIKGLESSYMSEYSKNYSASSKYEESSEPSEEIKPKKEIDPFKNLKITYTGSSPYIKAATDSSQCNSTVNKYFEFKTEDKYLRNGDEFTVTAVYNENDLEENGLAVTADTKTYVVENQAEYLTSVDTLDLSALQSELDDKLATTTATNKGDGLFAGVAIAKYPSGFDSIASKKLKSTYLISLKQAFEDKFGNNVYNRYMQLYEYTVNREDGMKINVYVIAYANNLNLGADGTVSWDVELGSKGYKNYDSLVTDYVTKNKEYYNVTEIK